MRVVLLALSVFILTDCAKTVEPIAYDCPRIVLPADPIPPTRKLTPNSTPGEVLKAWVATAKLYKGWNEAVRKQVNESR